MFKEQNAKNRIEKSSFFNEIFLENKALKLPKDYMEREESQTCLIEGLKLFYNIQNENLKPKPILKSNLTFSSIFPKSFLFVNAKKLQLFKL